MRWRIIVLGAVLAFSSGVAMAQSNAPDTASGRTTTPSGPGAPALSPSAPQNQNPMVNPNAAGTQRGWRGYGASSVAPGSPAGPSDKVEHGGTQPENANTHPLKALKTGKHRAAQRPAEQSGSSRPR